MNAGNDNHTKHAAGSCRILVVDDDATFRQRLVRALVARGHEAQDCDDPRDALSVAKAFDPDRVILDLRMPHRSGLEVLRELLAYKPSIRAVLLTGYGNIPTAVEAVRLGAVDYLTKPADADQILAAFERMSPADAPNSSSIFVDADASVGESVPSLARVEWEHISRVLTDCNGNISQAARVLGIHRRSLQRKLTKFPPHQ